MAERIFTVFEGKSHPDFRDEGDVKYHQGAVGVKKLERQRAQNPAFQQSEPSRIRRDPVVEGMARGKRTTFATENK